MSKFSIEIRNDSSVTLTRINKLVGSNISVNSISFTGGTDVIIHHTAGELLKIVGDVTEFRVVKLDFTTNIKFINLISLGAITNMDWMFYRVSGMQFSVADESVTANVTSMQCAWRECYRLKHMPAIDTSSVIGSGFSNTWYMCVDLKCIPKINTTNALALSSTFTNCNSLITPNPTEQALLTSQHLDWASDMEGCYKNKKPISYKVENIDGQDVVKEYIRETLEDI